MKNLLIASAVLSVFFIQSCAVKNGALKLKAVLLEKKGGDHLFRMEYRRNGGNAGAFRLRVVLDTPGMAQYDPFRKAVFIRENGAGNKALLEDLARVLRASNVSTGAGRTNELTMTCAVVGSWLSAGSGSDAIEGRFSARPSGDWFALKFFSGDGSGEFYLNINPKTGEAEIAMSNPSCGALVAAELAKVLL